VQPEGQRGGWPWPPQQRRTKPPGKSFAGCDSAPIKSRVLGDNGGEDQWAILDGGLIIDVAGDPMTGALIAPAEPRPSEIPARRREYRCECGHTMRVCGGARHRVYFDDAAMAPRR
jgi:hypothetical protein